MGSTRSRKRKRGKKRRKKNWVRDPDPLPWRHDWMETFLAVLEETGNAAEGARQVRLSTPTLYAYKIRCKRFGRRWTTIINRRKRKRCGPKMVLRGVK